MSFGSRSLPDPSKAQQERFYKIKTETGCIIARKKGLGFVQAEIHHLLRGGIRRGHDATIGLNPWSHRGVMFNGLTVAECKKLFGPSLALGSKTFHDEFGSDDELLDLQNELLSQNLNGWGAA